VRVVNVRMMIHAKSYAEIIEKAEKRLSSFLDTPIEDLANKINYEFEIYESSDDGVMLSTFTAAVHAKLK
jgi:hypothetical protein